MSEIIKRRTSKELESKMHCFSDNNISYRMNEMTMPYMRHTNSTLLIVIILLFLIINFTFRQILLDLLQQFQSFSFLPLPLVCQFDTQIPFNILVLTVTTNFLSNNILLPYIVNNSNPPTTLSLTVLDIQSSNDMESRTNDLINICSMILMMSTIKPTIFLIL